MNFMADTNSSMQTQPELKTKSNTGDGKLKLTANPVQKPNQQQGQQSTSENKNIHSSSEQNGASIKTELHEGKAS